MDIFKEQILKKTKTKSEMMTVALIYVSAWIIAAGIILLCLNFALLRMMFMLFVLLACGVIWMSFKLVAQFKIEYEYCVTNNLLDVDKIINKSSRKRLASIDISNVDEIGVYDESKLKGRMFDCKVNAVANDDDTVYFVTLRQPLKGRTLLLFQPNEKILNAIRGSLPRLLAYEFEKMEGKH